MSEQPLLTRTPDQTNAPLIPVKPPPDLAILTRVLAGLVRQQCKN
jgi:hypothetical protein